MLMGLEMYKTILLYYIIISDKVRATVKVLDEYGPVKEAAARESQAKQRLAAGEIFVL